MVILHGESKKVNSELKAILADKSGKAVLRAFKSKEARSSGGVARDTGIPKSEVEKILNRWPHVFIRPKLNSMGGIPLYTVSRVAMELIPKLDSRVVIVVKS